MPIYHNYTQQVPDGTATSVVRPSDWNAAHVYALQDAVSLGGNTDGVLALISTGTLFLAGGSNITLFQEGNSVSVMAGGGAEVVWADGFGASLTNNSIVFVGGFGATAALGQSADGRAVLSIGFEQTVQQMTGLTAGMSTGGNTAGTTGLVSNRLVLFGGNNVTLSQSVNGASATITIIGPTTSAQQSGLSGVVVSDATYTTGTVRFSNAGNITISSSVNGASQYVVLSGNAAQTVQSAIKGFGVSNTGATAGNTGISTGIDWVLAGSNLLTLSQSTAGGGPNTVWIQHPAWLTTAQPAGAYLTTARASTDAVGLNTALTANGVAWTVNSSGISLNVPAFLTTARGSTDAVGLNTALTANGVAWTVNSSGLSLNIPAFLTTARRSTDAIGLNTALTANGVAWTVDSSGLSLNVPAFLTTAANSTHSHGNPTLALTNLTGTTASASNGFTLSLSAAAAGVGGGATLQFFEPYPLANPNTTTWVPALGSWYFQPFVLPQNMAPGRINYLVSNSNSSAGLLKLSNGNVFSSNTTGTRSAHHVLADTWALYTRGTGASDTILSTVWSNTRAVSITQSVSIILTNATQIALSVSQTLSCVGSIGTDGAVTMTSYTASTATSTAGASASTTIASAAFSSLFNILSGALMVNVAITKSLTPGNYWLAAAYSTSQTTGGSSIGDILPFVHEVGIYGLSSEAYRGWGNTTSITSSQFFPGGGVFSAASNAAPASVAFNAIRSFASHVTQYFNMMQSSL